LREQRQQFALRSFGKLANRAAHREVGSVNDELPRSADTLLGGIRFREGGKRKKPDRERAENSGVTHVRERLKSETESEPKAAMHFSLSA
jgi:hypothetical protein